MKLDTVEALSCYIAELEANNTKLRMMLDDVLHCSQELETVPGWLCFPEAEGIIERIEEMLETEVRDVD